MIPEVSVILPTYNHADLVPNAIKSVLRQSFKDFELIVIDDKSTDNTSEVLASFNDPRIKILKHKENKGAPAARNTGYKTAKGKFISQIDSDDIWLPHKLKKQVSLLKRSPAEVGLVYCRLYNTKTHRIAPFMSNPIVEGNCYEQMLLKNPSMTTSMFYSKCLKKVGYMDERMAPFEDWDLWIRISKFYEFRFLDETLYLYLKRDDGIANNEVLRSKAFEIFEEKYKDDLKNIFERKIRNQLGPWNRLFVWGTGEAARQTRSFLSFCNIKPDAFLETSDFITTEKKDEFSPLITINEKTKKKHFEENDCILIESSYAERIYAKYKEKLSDSLINFKLNFGNYLLKENNTHSIISKIAKGESYN